MQKFFQNSSYVTTSTSVKRAKIDVHAGIIISQPPGLKKFDLKNI